MEFIKTYTIATKLKRTKKPKPQIITIPIVQVERSTEENKLIVEL